ncbi:MAG: DUF4476 domain-containing protein [Bacteroidetes bacterium]|nr:DUF4476 domain-containing protein [Bacteroidota bacterium]
MKKLLLLLLIIANFSAFAGWNKGMLRIREERGRTISVSIDAIRINKIGRTLTIPNVSVGKHMIKVFAYNSNGYGYRNGMMIYQGMIMVKPGSIYYCSVFEKGMEIEENCCIDDYGHWNNNDNWENWDEDMKAWNNNQRWNQQDNHWNHDNNNYEDNNWENYRGALSIGRYNQLIDQVRKTTFESSKITLLNSMLRNTKLTVAQLMGILKELTFESTKLQFAKDNYNKLVDPRNAFLINDLFTFQSSKDDFLEFIDRIGRR